MWMSKTIGSAVRSGAERQGEVEMQVEMRILV